MKNEMPLVSVIIPTYNRETYLQEAIESVVNQTYKSIEILVVDDGSDPIYADSNCKLFPNCKYLYKENGGLSSARNFGIANAKGDYIAFLDDDDFWASDKIEKQVKVLLENPNVDLVHSAAAVVDAKSEPTGSIIGASKDKASKRSGNVFWNALGTWVVKSPTPLIRKKIFDKGFSFDESIMVGEDIDFYQRFFYQHRIQYINEPLAFYRDIQTPERLSLQKQKYIGVEWKLFNNLKKMGVKNPLTLHRIAKRLLNSAERNWCAVYPEKSLKISKFNKNFRPQFCLKKYFNY